MRPEGPTFKLTADEQFQITRSCSCPLDARVNERCTKKIMRCRGSMDRYFKIRHARDPNYGKAPGKDSTP